MKTQVYDLLNAATYEEAIKISGETINNGGLVVFPTETVYGIGANALDEKAVAKIFAAKGRPADNPLIVHIADPAQIELLARDIPQDAQKVISNFMPGPVTVILKKKPCIPGNVTAGLDTVAVRIPASDYARDFLVSCGVPVAAPSANISGKPSPTEPKHVIDDMMGKVDVILTAGNCEIGIESTVIDFTSGQAKILRPGGLSAEKLSEIILLETPSSVNNKNENTPKSPGMKYRHYKPTGRVVALGGGDQDVASYINKQYKSNNICTAALVFEDIADKIECEHVFSLGNREEPAQGAKVLFSHLRKCDDVGAEVIYVMCTSNSGLGDAFLNRLYKASDQIIDLDER